MKNGLRIPSLSFATMGSEIEASQYDIDLYIDSHLDERSRWRRTQSAIPAIGLRNGSGV